MRIATTIGGLGASARLMALLAVATVPLGGLVVWGLSAGYETTLDMALAGLERTADVASDVPATLFANASSILQAAQADPSVRPEGGDPCRAALRSLLAGNPQFLTMGVMDRDGTITCHSRVKEHQSFTDPSLAVRALAPGATDTVVGNFMIGKVTGKPTVAVAAALPSHPGGVAFVSLDLERLSAAAEKASDDGSLAVTMIQPASGRMLTHFPPIPVAFGTPLEGSALVAAMRAQPMGGVVEASGPDGVERIYAFEPVRGSQRGMMLAVGERRSEILAPIVRTAWVIVLTGAVVLAVALASAWWIGWIMQVRPLVRVTQFAHRLDIAEIQARLAMEAWQSPELRALGHALNATAVRLETARQADGAIAASEARFRLLSENTADLVTALDANGLRTFASSASRDILGLEPDALVGGYPGELAHPADMPTVEAMLEALKSGRAVSDVRYRMRHGDGHFVWVEVGGRPLENGTGMIMAVRDVTRRRAMEIDLERANRALEELALTDGLTGVPNRRAFDAALAREIDRSRRDGTELGLLLVDIDRFKAFNDTYGHLEGDDCLRRVSSAILGAIRRPGDMAARYGGEEFAVILPGTGDQGTADRADAIVEAVRRLMVPNAGSEHATVTVSVGMAHLSMVDGSCDSALELIDRADRGLYAAKRSGRNRSTR